MSRSRLLALFMSLAVILGACGSDDEGGGSADQGKFSVEAELAHLPSSLEEPGAMVQMADLDAVSEAIGVARPESRDSEAWMEWAQAINSSEPGAPGVVFVPFADTLQVASLAFLEDFEAELGWSLADVSTFAELRGGLQQFATLTGDGISEKLFDDAEIAEESEGVFTVGEGEDLSVDPVGRTVARPFGSPLHMAARDGRLVVSRTKPTAEAWRSDGFASLAEVERFETVATRLDAANPYAAVLQDLGSGEGNGDANSATGAASLLGIGWSVRDGEPVITVVHHYGDEAVAAAQVADLEAVFSEGTTATTGDPISDFLVLESVEADGPTTITTLSLGERGRPSTVFDMMHTRDLPLA